jgi:hypothetical protein
MQTATGIGALLSRHWRRAAMQKMTACAILAVAAFLPTRSHAQWITDLETGVLVNSNLGNAQAGPDVHAATGLTASASTGPFFELTPGTNLLLAGQVKETAFDRYTAEDNVALGASARIDHKFGLGRQAPHVYLVGSETRLNFRDALRSGWLETLTLGSRAMFGDRLVLRGEFGLERRTAADAPALRAGLPSDVFDQSNRLLTMGADYSVNDALLLQLATTWRRGDADYIETTTLADSFEGASAVARDPVFGPSTFVEKVQAHALLIDIGASWALGEHASLNFIFRRQLTLDSSGDLYTRSMPALTYQYRFD